MRGFTLIELLVVIAVLGLLISILLPSLAAARNQARRAVCLANQRELGRCTMMYAGEERDYLPRSLHSAGFGFVNGHPWGYAFYRFLTGSPWSTAVSKAEWTTVLERNYRCPLDERERSSTLDVWSYGFNVYYELTPVENPGGPWRQLTRIPHASHAIVFGEVGGPGGMPIGGFGADHLMAHFWKQYDMPPDVASDRHRPDSAYTFLDGHVETRPLGKVFDVKVGIDLWDPATAR